jgi:hypothetical protein
LGNIHNKPNEIAGTPASPIILFGLFLQSLGVTSPTGWRWRKLGWITTLNIAGRVYVSRDEIKRFQQRAAAGEFSKTHKTPRRKAPSRMSTQILACTGVTNKTE